MADVKLAGFFAGVEPFRLLPTAAREQLALSAEIRRVGAKEIIFLENEEGERGFVIVSGRVALLKSSPNGRDLIVELLGPGDPFGVLVLLDRGVYPLTARAQVASTVVSITRGFVQPLVRNYPQLHEGFTTLLRKRLRSSHNLARSLAHDHVETRIASVLITLAGVDGTRSEVRIGRQELADVCATTIETASRIVKNFERSGVIATKPGVITILQLDILQELAAYRS